MQIIASPTERTTAATDALLGLIAVGYAAELLGRRRRAPWKAGVWAGTFGTLGAAGALGAVVHGLELAPRLRELLWRPLTLVLGVTVALFACGALGDLRGERAARRALPGALLGALGFYALSQRLRRGFLAFIAYEALAMLFALGVYVRLAQAGRLAGAQLMAAGVLLSIIAAAVQASRLELRLAGLPFDHNGLFHIIQIAGMPLLAAGLRAALDEAEALALSEETP
jgi:hypothetical protein